MDGKYIILRRLGQGSYGEVFLTRHVSLNVYRAVKRIRKSHDRLQTGRNEADILKDLSHSSLPIIYDIDEDDVYFYIVEEYIQGESLKEYVSKRGPLTEKEAVFFAMSICAVLDYMQEHGGICHLDIKPENIMVTPKGVKLLDFGSSLLAGSVHEYVTGTRGYAAPEMYRNGRLDGGCDIYAVGMLLAYMLSGAEAAQTKKIHINCSSNLRFIIYKCISHDREQRYSSAALLFQALETSQTQLRTTDNPIIIDIFGSGRGIGTTHFAIMLAAHFTAAKRRCLLETTARKEDTAKLPPIYSSVRHMECDGGMYRIEGVNLLPDYGEHIRCLSREEESRFEITIRDRGRLEDREYPQDKRHPGEGTFSRPEEAGRDHITILVAGHTLGELLEYEQAAKKLKSAGTEYITAINFTDGKEFIRIRKEHHIKKAFRIPYCVNPFSYAERRGFLEKIILPEECAKADAGHRRCRSLTGLWRDAFCLVCRQLSVKRKRQKDRGL